MLLVTARKNVDYNFYLNDIGSFNLFGVFFCLLQWRWDDVFLLFDGYQEATNLVITS